MGVPYKKSASLSNQYGGLHASRWVDLLSKSWIPFIQLARLDPSAALFLIYFPHLFGILQAANNNNSQVSEVLRVCVLLLAGSFFFSNTAHTWNDLVDSPIDKQVAQTKNRPIPRGDISLFKAFLFANSQAFGAAFFLLFFSPTTALATLPTIIGTAYYPWAKRHTHFAQVVLGLCLAWGIVVGNAAIGIQNPWKETGIFLLVLASTLWTVIYDTIYACQDIVDDKKIGVKSMAVLFGDSTKGLLWVMFFLMEGVLNGIVSTRVIHHEDRSFAFLVTMDIVKGESFFKQKPPLHFHANQDKYIQAVEVRMGIKIEGRELILVPGEKEHCIKAWENHRSYPLVTAQQEPGCNFVLSTFDAGGTYVSLPAWVPFSSSVSQMLGVIVGRWVGGLLGYQPFYQKYSADWGLACRQMKLSFFQRRFAETH
ncbi:hypothetical protein HYALB_00009538 [Hymenoscyphus albidus]|uniref:Uncharacterized protein n=1 Tax=Hymenoscyphus albidus TaxID=595503 RepID=A0A9N9M0N2_9HELO|nr:hypothetical protein HYALB_00009538 [Hymenoscyphus albidus]